MLDRPISKRSSATFYKLWHRNCLVAGFRHDPRFYAMRVGAAARLDGVLTDAVRNSILSHSTPVFQDRYQTSRLRDDLMKLAFGRMAGDNDDLFQNLRNISLSRDSGAPIYLSKEELQTFEGRSDLTSQRKSLKAAKDARDVDTTKSTQSSIDTLISTLSGLKIQEKRAEYFNRVDNLRARGLHRTPLHEMPYHCGPKTEQLFPPFEKLSDGRSGMGLMPTANHPTRNGPTVCT